MVNNPDEIHVEGLVVYRLQRLRYLRTLHGPAVINDLSRPLYRGGLSVQELDVGDFVEAIMIPTEPIYNWRRENPYRVIKFAKIDPPNGVEVTGEGYSTEIICDIIYSTIQLNSKGDYCDIYKAPFIDMIFDLNKKINKSSDKDAIYKCRMSIDMVRKKAGSELVIRSHISTRLPDKDVSTYEPPFRRANNSPSMREYQEASSSFCSLTPTPPIQKQKFLDSDVPRRNTYQPEPRQVLSPRIVDGEPNPHPHVIDDREERCKKFFFQLWRHKEIREAIEEQGGDLFDDIIHRLSIDV
ncbi:unnamed protein product, partial [Mesorhabditis belari]|uniref:Uncharacterized protein n=1 Tax=Mesorhabditis belari TaxID=2138241 RepID=A0AAF3FCB6_9BILA